MPNDADKPAIRAALRAHEIGSATPYRLYFAGKGKSGASFGFMQGDLAAGQPVVTQTFRSILAAASFSANAIDGLIAKLSVHLIVNPLDPTETSSVNAALVVGHSQVDAMDEDILGSVYGSLDGCIARAETTHPGSGITLEAQLYIALWINMAGPPNHLLIWIGGGDPQLAKPVPLLGPGKTEIGAADVEAYLLATDYFIENPRNFVHMQESVAIGMEAAPGRPAGVALEAAMPGTDTGLADGFVYEQATGHLYRIDNGARDLFATGYSGSDQDNGKNNPAAQCDADIGPLPRGIYTIGDPIVGPSPYSLRLTPSPDNHMCGRGGFLIHGDSIAAPGTASHGCIIMARPDRERIHDSGVRRLQVTDHL